MLLEDRIIHTISSFLQGNHSVSLNMYQVGGKVVRLENCPQQDHRKCRILVHYGDLVNAVLKYDGTIAKSSKEKAELFNLYFSSV